LFRTGFALAALVFAWATPSHGDWREEIGTFRVAITASDDARQAIARSEPFRLALERALGLPVEIVAMRDYPAMIEAAARSRIEYAVFSAFAYGAAFARCQCVEPMVSAVFADGDAAFHQILLVRPGGARDPAALKYGKVGLAGSEAAGGAMLAAHELRKAGLDLEAPGATLTRFAGSMEAIAALEDGSVDALIGWSSLSGDAQEGYSRGTLRQIAQWPAGRFEALVIWRSPPVPHRVHAVRKNLDGEAKTVLRGVLGQMFGNDPVAYDSIERIYGGGFVSARQSQFEPLAQMFREKGLASGGE
jgi:phosphonate transport system substrate-binding protein